MQEREEAVLKIPAGPGDEVKVTQRLYMQKDVHSKVYCQLLHSSSDSEYPVASTYSASYTFCGHVMLIVLMSVFESFQAAQTV